MAIRTNLEVTRGDTKSYQLKFKDENGNAVDITGWTVYFTVKRKVNDTDANAVIVKNVTSHTDASAGETVIALSCTDTNLIGNYYYDIQFKTDDDSITTPLEGTITFKKDITQRS